MVASMALASNLIRAGGWSMSPGAGGGGGGEEDMPPTASTYPNLSVSQLIGAYTAGRLTYEQVYAALRNGAVGTGGYGTGRSPLSATEINAMMERQAADPFENPTMDYISRASLGWLTGLARDAGMADPGSFAASFLSYHWNDVVREVNKHSWQYFDKNPIDNTTGQLELFKAAQSVLRPAWQWGGAELKSGRGSGGRSIAQSFDIDQLANSAREMWNVYLRADPNVDPKILARAYVQEVTDNPNQALDFATWVKKRMQQDPTWGFVFRNKPPGTADEDYIRQYADAVTSVVGPAKDANQIIQQLASLNASGDSIGGRLRLHESVQKSTGFMNRVEGRYRSARKMLGAMY